MYRNREGRGLFSPLIAGVQQEVLKTYIIQKVEITVAFFKHLFIYK